MKMRTRIRYYELTDELVTDWFTVGPNLIVRAWIIPSKNLYHIRTFDAEVLHTGTCSNLRYVKSKVRKLLVEVGVKLGEEIRVVNV